MKVDQSDNGTVAVLLFQLATGPHSAAYELLQLFAYGTYSTYKGMSAFTDICCFIQHNSII